MTNIKQKLVSAKTTVAANRTRILVTALVVTTTVAVIERVGLKQHDDFLREHNLFDAFYTLTDEV